MKLNFQGRIGNVSLPFSRALSPVFEAVVNSIHAIEDAQVNDGSITLRILRNVGEARQPTLTGERLTSRSIVAFVVEDNGIGFTGQHYESFETSDTDLKKERGAKGVGRFLWLKAFNSVRVDSIFEEAGEFWQRKFTFSLSANGIADHELRESAVRERRTTIELLAPDSRYEREYPRLAQTIAERIIEHCLSYLFQPTWQSFRLVDDDEDASIDLLELSQHTIHLCAHNRDVQHLPLANYIPYIPPRLKSQDGRAFVYKAYVASAFLDERVNAERTGFNLAREGDLQSRTEPTEEALINRIVDAASIELGPLLNEVEDRIKQRIGEVVTKHYPEYRPILKNVDSHIREFKEHADDREIVSKLNEIQFREDIEAREEVRQLLAESDPKVRNSEKYIKLQKAYAEKAHDLAQSRLAQCVIHRRIILDLMQAYLSIEGNGKFPKEDKIHELIFPLRVTSDDISWERQNLWIVDERLVYHRFLASDKPIASFAENRKDKDEPDLFVLNHPAVFTASSDVPLNSVLIVEFKRAERTQFDQNPIQQVLGYVRKLRDAKIRDARGRTVNVHPDAAFTCYIIADLTKQLRQMAEEANLDPTPDMAGYFGFNRNYKAYLEIISYDKLLHDSNLRNRELFKALELE
jgi:hypothetical protein